MQITGMTGEKVTNPGIYQNKYGKKISLQSGNKFPPCPKEGNPIKWAKVDE
ncbi:hypothetical protein [Crassaminicella profunda]|uniref:hypothetical protein n=1 Tax=Crassaminicella profunda TaxID=1286698 RepID=UPI001CA6E86F|nr:hypothetical protein [Crassaminicella profunda]QZY56622.1 hypothetical protein K7H06_06805 [Crassaminicella profunda]